LRRERGAARIGEGGRVYKIIVKERGRDLREVPLDKPRLVFGRDPSNEVALADDSVSSHHFSIESKQDKIVLRDEGSLNGTFLGNSKERVKTANLGHGDIIRVGHTLIKLVKVRGTLKPAEEYVRRPRRPQQTIVASDIRVMEKELDSVVAKIDAIRQDEGAEAAARAAELAEPFTHAREKLSKVGKSYDRLTAMYEASKHIISGFDLEERLNLVMDSAIEVLQAERGFLMLKDEETEKLELVVKRKMGGEELSELGLSMSVANEVAATGEPILATDASVDPNLKGRGSIILHKILSIMCVPLKIEDRVLGVIYLDNRAVQNAFDESDRELFSAFASLSAIAIESARLFKRLQYEEKVRTTMSRSLPRPVVEMLMKNPEDWIPGGTLQKVTVMFSDIRGFTTMSAQMTPNETVDMLNEYFDELSNIIFAHQGTIDKFMGDAIMAIFGAPFSYGDDADRAVLTAIDMIRKVCAMNETAEKRHRRPFDIGIGINTGTAIAGNVGNLDRMDYTVIGDMVNTAFRLTSAAERNQILISKETMENIQADIDVLDVGIVKTKDVQVEAFEVVVPRSGPPGATVQMKSAGSS
jgi:adenylate cyclase